MIKFFRRLRQDLVTGTKSIRYFKYAAGEIFLVVIGILIALQINNWNESRKEAREEEKILSNLQAEFVNNLAQLKENIDGTNNAIRSGKTLLDLMNGTDTINYSSSMLDSLLRRTITTPFWFPSSLAMNDLISSGRIAKLTNMNLRQGLYEYNAILDEIGIQEKLSSKAYEFYLEYIKKHGGLRQIDNTGNDDIDIGPSTLYTNNSMMLTEFEFENALDDYYIFLTLRVRQYERAGTIIQSIIDQAGVNQSTRKERLD
jgi:hypothetical protein